MPHVRQRLRLGLDDIIANRLHQSVPVFNPHIATSPRLAVQRVPGPAVPGGPIFPDFDGSRRFGGNRFDALGILEEKPALHPHRQDVTGYAECHRPVIGGQGFGNVANFRREEKLQPEGSGSSGRERFRGRRVPRLQSFPVRRGVVRARTMTGYPPVVFAFPFVLGISQAVRHPFIESLESLAQRCQVADLVVLQGFVSLQRRFAVGSHHQRRPVPVQTGHLHITAVQADGRIGERRHGLHPPLVAVVTRVVVENQRNAQRADFHRNIQLVLDIESQDQPPVFHRPGANDLQRTVAGQRGGQVRRSQRRGRRRQGRDRLARRRRGKIGPGVGAVGAQPEGQIAKLIKAVGLPRFELVGRNEIESVRVLHRQRRQRLRILHQLEIEVRRFQFEVAVGQPQGGRPGGAAALGLDRLRNCQ